VWSLGGSSSSKNLSGRCWDASWCSEPLGRNFCCIKSIGWLAVKTPANCSHLVSLLFFEKWDYFFFILGPFHTGSALGEERGSPARSRSPEPVWMQERIKTPGSIGRAMETKQPIRLEVDREGKISI